MAYTALYRKFRPGTFEEVKGQDAIVKTLSNQIKGERVGHAYLFCGTRGTGKTSVAKIFARAINCENPKDGSPCNECAVCRGIIDGTSMNVVEIDAASNNGVENVRQIVEEVKYSPTEGKYRVYIIDEVHMLSPGAFNALLKTLEEPPSYVVFILATTEAHKIPITILSRCQRYDFKRISSDTICARLEELCEKEGIAAEKAALRYIARCGEGSMRDALSLLERCVSFFFGEELTYDKIFEILGTTDVETFAMLLRYISMGDVGGCMKTVDSLVAAGRDLSRVIVDFSWYMRNLLLAKTGYDIAELLEVSSEQMKILEQESRVFDTEELLRYIRVCSELTNRLRFATQKRVIIEIELIGLCRPQMVIEEPAYADRLRRLEKQLEDIKAKGGFAVAEDREAEEEDGGESGEDSFELPEAAEEDVIKLRENWRNVTNELDMPYRLNVMAASCRVNKNGSFILVCTNTIDEGVILSHKAEVEELLEKKTGKRYTFDVVLGKENARESVDVYEYKDKLTEQFAGVTVEIK